jgi:DNA-binding NarL/FixJ family response regulator
VLVVAEDPLARGGLAALVAASGGLAVVDRVGPEEVAAAVRAHRPDVVVWDARGGEPAAELVAAGPPVLAVIAAPAEAAYVPGLLGGGVRGVVSRDADAARLGAAIRAVAADIVAIDHDLAEAALRSRVPAGELVEALTAREREVMDLLAQGLTNRVIADRLHISEHTVKFHVNAILGKLGAQTRAEAIVHAVRLGLIVL